MKATGIVRKLDSLGRIVIPKELRKTLDMKEGTPIEIFTDGENITFREYKPYCIFCGDAGDTTVVSGRQTCQNCLNKIRSM